MKKLLYHLGLCLSVILLATGCGSNNLAELLEHVPADADFVITGDIKTILESAGGKAEGSEVKMPDYIGTMQSDRDAREMEKDLQWLKNSGIDVTSGAVVFLKYQDRAPFIVFAITDKDKLKKALEVEGFNENDKVDDVDIYVKKDEGEYGSYTRNSYVAIDGGYGYWIPDVWSDDDKGMKMIKQYLLSLSNNTMASTDIADYVSEGNVAGMIAKLPSELRREMAKAGVPEEMANLYSGYVCINSKLDGDEAEARLKLFDENGKAKTTEDWNKMMDIKAKIDPEALAYMSPEENLIYAVSMKNINWDKYMDQFDSSGRLSRQDKSVLTVVKSYLEKFDGTVAIGVGLKNGKASIEAIDKGEEVLNHLPVTIVAQTKEGKAASLIKDVKSLLGSQNEIFYTSTANGLRVNLPKNIGTLWFEAKDNMLILSSNPIKKGSNPVAEHVNFQDYIFAAALHLGKDNPLMRDFDVKSDLTATIAFDAEAGEAVLKLKMTGDGEAGLIERFLRSVIGMGKKYEQMREERRQQYYEDYMAADTLPYEPEPDCYYEEDSVAVD
ncbi:MAG: DUF4836 family protein [Alloprevotella sp.]|nr:DUF4836 family protein [Bacteroidales bacterium]MDY2624405.1 DUF4836 family protein [Alloprevotella sp.]